MKALLEATGARALVRGAPIQELWSGYGELFRARLEGAEIESVVIKRVVPPIEPSHPRGWTQARGHQRKLRSYQVEHAFYQDWAELLPPEVRVAKCVAAIRAEEDGRPGWWFVLEDLDAAGFSKRRRDVRGPELDACLRWLASFHARFLGLEPTGLWPVGTYWHLDTRPDEFAALEDPELIEAAPQLDARLNHCRFRTLVHGDAKPANFCFGPNGVAGVDFQYVGGGPGVKDVAYFLSSLSDVTAVEADAEGHLDTYFSALRDALKGRNVDLDALEAEGRQLYPLAWADFYRFLAGWAPDHWKINRYSRRMTRQALKLL